MIWITCYILYIYKKDRVYVPVYEKAENPNTDEGENSIKVSYREVMKSNYIMCHIICPIIMSIAFLLFFIAAREWAKRHENQEKAYG